MNAYDDENRLGNWYYYDGGYDGGGSPTSEYDLRTQFIYDGQGRLRKKIEHTTDGVSWNVLSQTWYVYDGKRVIQERTSANTPAVSYTRGNDLSGSLEGAGGIGGLLARSQGTTHASYFADGNGNITALSSGNLNVVAAYRYDPYGNLVSKSGTLADANLYRFSSKEFHVNSGMYYYLYRFYHPNFQRWLNRDPIGERGFEAIRRPAVNEYADGPNVYAFVLNDPLNQVDYFGLAPGGPYHPPSGVSLSCDPSDSCGRLGAKMTLLMKMIASHTGWDRSMPPPRGGGRHADETADLWRAYARCQAIHAAKNCQDPKPPSCWDRVIMKVPGSDRTWENVGTGCAIVSGVAVCGAIIIGTGGAATPVLVPAL